MSESVNTGKSYNNAYDWYYIKTNTTRNISTLIKNRFNTLKKVEAFEANGLLIKKPLKIVMDKLIAEIKPYLGKIYDYLLMEDYAVTHNKSKNILKIEQTVVLVRDEFWVSRIYVSIYLDTNNYSLLRLRISSSMLICDFGVYELRADSCGIATPLKITAHLYSKTAVFFLRGAINAEYKELDKIRRETPEVYDTLVFYNKQMLSLCFSYHPIYEIEDDVVKTFLKDRAPLSRITSFLEQD